MFKAKETTTIVNKSPVFVDALNFTEINIELNKWKDKLTTTSSENTFQEVRDYLNQFEILTLINNKNQTEDWLLSDVYRSDIDIDNPLGLRIKHLFQSKGKWKRKKEKIVTLYAETKTKLPLTYPLYNHIYQQMQENKNIELKYKIELLQYAMSTIVMEQGQSKKTNDIILNWFKRPNGIVNNNMLASWLTEVSKDQPGYNPNNVKSKNVSVLDIIDNMLVYKT